MCDAENSTLRVIRIIGPAGFQTLPSKSWCRSRTLCPSKSPGHTCSTTMTPPEQPSTETHLERNIGCTRLGRDSCKAPGRIAPAAKPELPPPPPQSEPSPSADCAHRTKNRKSIGVLQTTETPQPAHGAPRPLFRP